MKIRVSLFLAGVIAAGWIGVYLPRAVVFAAEAVVAPAPAMTPPSTLPAIASVTELPPKPIPSATLVSRPLVARQTPVVPIQIQVLVRDSVGRYV